VAEDAIPGPLIVDLVPHLDAGDRATWPGDQDQRPLSDLGWRQAEALATALAAEPAGLLVASPALRAIQTLQPLAHRLGLSVEVAEGLAEKRPGEDTPALATRGEQTLLEIARKQRTGRVVACSHGDIIPAVIARLSRAHGVSPPPLERRGQWYRLLLFGPAIDIEMHFAKQTP
jgi:8-oxo-dGTP diphosphatase